MKRKMGKTVLLTLVLALSLTAGCGISGPKQGQMGSTNANIVNGGASVMVGETIYFANYAENNFYAIQAGENEGTKVCDDSPGSINYYRDWLYYADANTGGKIVKIKPDGSGRTVISDRSAGNVIVYRDWIYYIDGTDAEDETSYQKIHRIKLDGSDPEKLSDDPAVSFNITDEEIFYVKAEEQLIYRMGLDGTERTPVSDQPVTFLNVQPDFIYFTDVKDSGSHIYRMKHNGSDPVKLSEDPVMSFNTDGEWIYYSRLTEEGMQLKRMKTDGSEAEVINEDDAWLINVHDDWLVYIGIDMNTFSVTETIVNVDGSGRKDYMAATQNPSEELEILPMGSKAAGDGITVIVHSAWYTNVLRNGEPGWESEIFDSVSDGHYLFVNMNIWNEGNEAVDLYRLTGLIEDLESDGMTIYFAALADTSGESRRLEDGFCLPRESYSENYILEAGESRDFQAYFEIMTDPAATVLGLLRLGEIEPLRAIDLSPVPAALVFTQDEALGMIREVFAGQDVRLIQGVGWQMPDDEYEKVYYLFEVGPEGSEEAGYYLVKRDTGEIWTGIFDEDYPDYPAVPHEPLK